MNDAIQQMLHTWTNGGWVMAALACVAAIMYASATHLLFQLHQRGLTKVSDDDLRFWVKEPAKAPSQIGELIRYTREDATSVGEIHGRFREVEAAKIPDVDRRIAFLNVMVVASPLFGLLGTVLGMLLTFRAIGMGGGSSTSEIIAKGISEALVATQTGMMVAIPGLIAAFVAKRWRNEYVAFLTRLEGVSLRSYRHAFIGIAPAVRARAQAVEPQSSDSVPDPVAA